MAASMRIVFGLLTLVTIGMIIGALVQLAFIRRLEDSYGSEFPTFGMVRRQQLDGYLQLPGGIHQWNDDKEAATLRVGYFKIFAICRLNLKSSAGHLGSLCFIIF